MPSYLDFNSTKSLRDFLIGKTLNQPNGPQTFNSSNYEFQKLNDFPDLYQGTVEDVRPNQLVQSQNSNTYKPEKYFIDDTLHTLPRKANLSLYPYFVSSDHNLIGIMTSGDDTTESELYRFAAHFIKTDSNGPVLSRVRQNLETATIGRLRIIDALQGNTTTAINILTGREPLIEKNEKITVSSSIIGKGIDFLETVSGIQLPFSTIPGDYLSNPNNPINFRPTPSTELGSIIQDTTGAIGSLLGIQRRPLKNNPPKPSDLFIQHMGDGQKSTLFNLLSYSKYAPNYTTTARSQNTSKIFNFIDNASQSVKNALGIEAPAGVSYIGDDRGNNMSMAMNDFNDRPVHSTYFLNLLFDPIQTDYFEKTKTSSEGGEIAGKLTWYGINSGKNNKLGANNVNYKTSQESKFTPTLSTNTTFRNGSILSVTQDILNTIPPGGQARTHVGNVIDQTSRVFKEGQKMLSRGSAIKYVDKTTGIESGVEYCRVWTKDRPYFTFSDTMKRTSNIRKFDGSVMGGQSRVWNLNMGPISNGNKGFENSTNIFETTPNSGDFYAKKYMFSIENLAWKTSNKPGFTVQDLPECERGNNQGRVMWFPPYDLKINESNAARWESNTFLGRPEPIYTYQNTERSGSLSFKVIVDHPSILNLLIREKFKGMSDDEADNYINAYFAGCKDEDLYKLVQTYNTLTTSELDAVKKYINDKGDTTTILKYKTTLDTVTVQQPVKGKVNDPVKTSAPPCNVNLKFLNDIPSSLGGDPTQSSSKYGDLYKNMILPEVKENTKTTLGNSITVLMGNTGNTNNRNDLTTLFGGIPTDNLSTVITNSKSKIEDIFTVMATDYNTFTTTLMDLKNQCKNGTVTNIKVSITSSCSAVAEDFYNLELSIRRTDSIIDEILSQLSNPTKPSNKFVVDVSSLSKDGKTKYPNSFTYTLDEFGYTLNPKETVLFTTSSDGEHETLKEKDCSSANFNNRGLKVASPIAFTCRQSEVKITYDIITSPSTTVDTTTNVTSTTSKTSLESQKTTTNKKKPPVDLMKRIIMKTLTEGYYFKKLEETDPLVFSSLREKLRYFHPAFHSTTPEGLNSRLTFLHQCIRPGDTIPIKGLPDDKNLDSRNTSFGPPPICVLRIGDFYNSKIIIESMNISYEENLWDLNPDGIGVQPMIATVTLNIKFIGGQGLENPVDRLQNALSSNFYANTEMYDERSISTNTKINGVDTNDFTKDFLEKLSDNNKKEIKPNSTNKGNSLKSGSYIGTISKQDDLTTNIDRLFENISTYFNNYTTIYNNLLVLYGNSLLTLFLSPNYRTIKNYNVKTPTSSTQIELFGLYKNGNDLNDLSQILSTELKSSINNSTDLSAIFDFSSSAFKKKVGLITTSNDLLKPYLLTVIDSFINKLNSDTSINDFEKNRNKLISSLDDVNYLITYNCDATLNSDGNNGSKGVLDGFLIDDFYGQYSTCIDYITKNSSKLYNKIDNSLDLVNNDITDDMLKKILPVIIKSNKGEILNLYKTLPNTFTQKIMNDIEGNLNDFINVKINKVDLGFDKTPKRSNSKKLTYNITSTPISPSDGNIFSDLIKIKSTKNNVTESLNFYRNE